MELEAEKYKIEVVCNAIHEGKPTNDLIAIKYLEALGKVADGQATKIFLPLETAGVTASRYLIAIRSWSVYLRVWRYNLLQFYIFQLPQLFLLLQLRQ